MTDIQSLVERVLRLDKEATKGPWFAVASGHRIRIHGPFKRPDGELVPSGVSLHHLECWEPKTGAGRGQSPTWLGFTKEQVADMDLAATYRTAAPILANEVLRLRAELAEERRRVAVATRALTRIHEEPEVEGYDTDTMRAAKALADIAALTPSEKPSQTQQP